MAGEVLLSQRVGKGYVGHNLRIAEFGRGKNIDDSRRGYNIVFVGEEYYGAPEMPPVVRRAHSDCFGQALLDYNAKQTRKDRQIKTDYYDHLFSEQIKGLTDENQPMERPAKKGKNGKEIKGVKNYCEDIVQFGNSRNCAWNTPQGDIAKECLVLYWNGCPDIKTEKYPDGIPSYKDRNKNFHVFASVIHSDEQHRRIDAEATTEVNKDKEPGQKMKRVYFKDANGKDKYFPSTNHLQFN